MDGHRAQRDETNAGARCTRGAPAQRLGPRNATPNFHPFEYKTE